MEEEIPTIFEESEEEELDTMEEDALPLGVTSVNGLTGDVPLKTVNGQEVTAPGPVAFVLEGDYHMAILDGLQNVQVKAFCQIGKTIVEGDQLPAGQFPQLLLSVAVQAIQFLL